MNKEILDKATDRQVTMDCTKCEANIRKDEREKIFKDIRSLAYTMGTTFRIQLGEAVNKLQALKEAE